MNISKSTDMGRKAVQAARRLERAARLTRGLVGYMGPGYAARESLLEARFSLREAQDHLNGLWADFQALAREAQD